MAEKTAPPAGVTGRVSDLLNANHDSVSVAVDMNGFDLLDVSAFLTLMPKLLTASGPINHLTQFKGSAKRILIHMRHHENFSRIGILSDGRHETTRLFKIQQ